MDRKARQDSQERQPSLIMQCSHKRLRQPEQMSDTPTLQEITMQRSGKDWRTGLSEQLFFEISFFSNICTYMDKVSLCQMDAAGFAIYTLQRKLKVWHRFLVNV